MNRKWTTVPESGNSMGKAAVDPRVQGSGNYEEGRSLMTFVCLEDCLYSCKQGYNQARYLAVVKARNFVPSKRAHLRGK